MNKKRVIVLISALCIIGTIIILNVNKEKILDDYIVTVHNNLRDITIEEIFINGDSANLLANNLPPSSSIALNLSEQNLISLIAIDSNNGVYTPMVHENDAEISINITDRFEFDNTIETGGEYWAGAGTEVLHVTNRLNYNDIYTLTISPYQSSREDSDNLLQAFILYPGHSISVRLNTGCYSVAAIDNENNQYIVEPVNIYENSEAMILAITAETQYYDLETSGEGSFSISLVNDLDDWVITEIYHKESSTSEWSTNHINFQSLEPKQAFTLNLQAGTYDIRVIDEVNDSYTNLNVSLNEDNFTWNITMNNLDPFIP